MTALVCSRTEYGPSGLIPSLHIAYMLCMVSGVRSKRFPDARVYRVPCNDYRRVLEALCNDYGHMHSRRRKAPRWLT